MLNELLCKKYQLTNFGDTVTKSRIKNKDFREYDQLISVINSSKDICIKLNGNDFFDPITGKLTELYKQIDYNSFDKIIMLTRKNYIDAILSYGYMDPTNSETWHRKKSQTVEARAYTIQPTKIYHLLNGYRAYETIKDYIKTVVDSNMISESDFDNFSELLNQLELKNIDIDLRPMGINYKSIVTNYDEILDIANEFFNR